MGRPLPVLLLHGRLLHHAYVDEMAIVAGAHLGRVHRLPQLPRLLPVRVHLQREPSLEFEHHFNLETAVIRFCFVLLMYSWSAPLVAHKHS